MNELLQRELCEDGYSGVEVRVTPVRTEVIIRATRYFNIDLFSTNPVLSISPPSCFSTQNVLGEKGRRIRELTLLVQQRFKFPVFDFIYLGESICV